MKGAHAIMRARRSTTLGERELRKLGIAYKRARFFVTCNGSYAGQGTDSRARACARTWPPRRRAVATAAARTRPSPAS